MVRKGKTSAYIDGANLYRGIKELGWELDYRRFRTFLKEKYQVRDAYLFIGRIETNGRLYEHLERCGFRLIYKETHRTRTGDIKGNCDAELVLHATCDFYEGKYDQAVLITGDGDFACLAHFLKQKGKLQAILSPNHAECSYLLRKVNCRLAFLEDIRKKLERRRG